MESFMKKKLDTIVIKLNKCSTLTVHEHKISKTISSSIKNDRKQMNLNVINDNISLSKLTSYPIKKLSNISSDKISH